MSQFEGNKIIALYMGEDVPYKSTKINGSRITTFLPPSKISYKEWANVDLNYHKSFDALIPVAKKLHEESKYKSLNFDKGMVDFDINTLWESVVDYIQWLNNN
jgi:hypothetical protein